MISPITGGELHAQVVPPRLVKRTIAPRLEARSAAPR